VVLLACLVACLVACLLRPPPPPFFFLFFGFLKEQTVPFLGLLSPSSPLSGIFRALDSRVRFEFGGGGGGEKKRAGLGGWVREDLVWGDEGLGAGLEQERGVRGVVGELWGGLRVLWIYIYNFSIIAAVMVWYRPFS